MIHLKQENGNKPQLLNDKNPYGPFDFIHQYIVSLSVKDNIPGGSGTLVKFTVTLKSGAVIDVFAVLTATHVLEGLITSGLTLEKPIILSKPIDRSGAACAAEFAWGFAIEFDGEHLKYIVEKLPGIYSGIRERDASLIILSYGTYPKNVVTDCSKFYDLLADDSESLLPGDKIFYFKSPCSEDNLHENVLQDTGLRSAFLICEQSSSTSSIPHLVFKYEDNVIYHGASGAGMWLFTKNQDGTVHASLAGIFFGGIKDKNEIYAIGRKYINETLLSLTMQRISEN